MAWWEWWRPSIRGAFGAHPLTPWWFYAYNANTFSKKTLMTYVGGGTGGTLVTSLWLVTPLLLPMAILGAGVYGIVESWNGVEVHEGD